MANLVGWIATFRRSAAAAHQISGRPNYWNWQCF